MPAFANPKIAAVAEHVRHVQGTLARGRKVTGEWGQTNEGQVSECWIRLSSFVCHAGSAVKAGVLRGIQV